MVLAFISFTRFIASLISGLVSKLTPLCFRIGSGLQNLVARRIGNLSPAIAIWSIACWLLVCYLYSHPLRPESPDEFPEATLVDGAVPISVLSEDESNLLPWVQGEQRNLGPLHLFLPPKKP